MNKCIGAWDMVKHETFTMKHKHTLHNPLSARIQVMYTKSFTVFTFSTVQSPALLCLQRDFFEIAPVNRTTHLGLVSHRSPRRHKIVKLHTPGLKIMFQRFYCKQCKIDFTTGWNFVSCGRFSSVSVSYLRYK